MGKLSNYWILIKPNTQGRFIDDQGNFFVNKESAQAQAWFYEQFPDLRNVSVTSKDRAIQRRLMEMRSAEMIPENEVSRQLADYCLRCFISHQLAAGCIELERQFGRQGSFTQHDLFPLVLDDVFVLKHLQKQGDKKSDFLVFWWTLYTKIQNDQSRKLEALLKLEVLILNLISLAYLSKASFADQILEKFNPSVSNLSTWTRGAVRQYEPLTDFLEKDCNIYLSTDWAVLNAIGNLSKLKRILSRSGILLIPDEKDKLWSMIERYYDNYCKENLPVIHAEKVSSFPTDKQLDQMIDDIQKELIIHQKEQQFLPEKLRFLYARDITPEKFKQRVLNYCSRYKPTLEKLYKTWYLLNSYYEIYRNCTLGSSRAGKKCLTPTNEQFQRMSNRLKEFGFAGYQPESIHEDLLTLAEAARQYKRPAPVNHEESCTEPYEEIEKHDDIDFLAEFQILGRFRREFLEYLDEAIKQVVSKHFLGRQKQCQRCLEAHCLFYCEGMSHAAIAPKFNVKVRTIAGDLEAEKTITKVCHNIANTLIEQIEELGTAHYDQSQLQRLNDEIQKALKKVVKPKYDQAIAEIFTRDKYPKRSLIMVRICCYVERLMGEL